MSVFSLMRVSYIFIVYLFSAYTYAIEISIIHNLDADPKYIGEAYTFECHRSYLNKIIWIDSDISTSGKVIICCIRKNNMSFYLMDHEIIKGRSFLKTEDTYFNRKQVVKLKFKTTLNNKPLRSKYILKFVIKLQKFQDFIRISPEEKLFLSTTINTIGSFADIDPTLMFAHLSRIYDISANNDKVNGLVKVLLLLDNRKEVDFVHNSYKGQDKKFVCTDGQCDFHDNLWDNVCEHMRISHPYQQPSKILSNNKLNHENRGLAIDDHVVYVPCQAVLARGIQSSVYNLANNGIKVSYYTIMELYIKREFKVTRCFDEIGYGSIQEFSNRHMINFKIK